LTSACLSPDDCLDHLDGRTDSNAVESTQKHLDECPACCVLMAEAVRGDGGAERRRMRPFLTLSPGDRVAGRYEVRRFIARGGMGEVYEAFDSVLQERVALKTLVLAALDQEEATSRLLGEVRAARRVVHPNVCRILDVGFHRWPDAPDSPLPFLTMDYLSGETLAHRIARAGRLPPSDALRFVRDLCAGLGAVHRAGIVHRDFKSENVFLVVGPDAFERAVVMDFGLAWVLEREASARRSSGKSVLGTVDYMAPEQVEGQELSSAADVYALGVVMFEMLAGRTPFPGNSAAAVALSRLSREAPKVSSLAPELGTTWDAIIGRCLARDPALRFRQADDVAARLDSLESRQTRRRPMVGVAIALGVTTALALALAMAKRPRPADGTAAVGTSLPVTPSLAVTVPPAAAVHVPEVAAASPPPQPTVSRRPTRTRSIGAAPGVEPSLAVVRDARPAGSIESAAQPAVEPGATGDREARLDAAEDLLAEGKIREACALGERSAELRAALPDAYRFLGRCYMRLGRPSKARANYRKYLERAGAAADASFVRAIVGSETR
jgi:tRNA A-37 threonylcarbamoyl transferase component Bud32